MSTNNRPSCPAAAARNSTLRCLGFSSRTPLAAPTSSSSTSAGSRPPADRSVRRNESDAIGASRWMAESA